MNSPLTIFYTDDDQDDLDFFKDVVSSLDLPVDVVTQNKPDKLLSDLQNPPPSPQIIFLDVNMPGKNGFDLLKEIRDHETFQDIPVVMFSTSSDEGYIAKKPQTGGQFLPAETELF